MQVDDLKLYQWAAKIYYGILRKELTLKHDRTDMNSPSILASTDFQHFKMMHFIMQSIRKPVVFPSGAPYSVLVANLHTPSNVGNFDFRDNMLGHVIKIRLGNIGFIVAFEDGAINEHSYGNYLRKVAGRKLHPIQFDELFARIIYQNFLIDSQLNFVLAMHEDEMIPISIDVVGSVRVGERDQKEFAEFFWEFCNYWFEANDLTFDDVFKPPNLVVSWMSDVNDNLILLDENGDRVKELE